MWRTWSIASGSDVTWGILDAMAGALGIAPWELEGPEEAFLDLPEAERCVLCVVCLGIWSLGWFGG